MGQPEARVQRAFGCRSCITDLGWVRFECLQVSAARHISGTARPAEGAAKGVGRALQVAAMCGGVVAQWHDGAVHLCGARVGASRVRGAGHISP